MAIFGLSILADYFLGWHTGTRFAHTPDRPSFPTGFCVMSLGFAMAFMEVQTRRVWIAEVLAVGSAQAALLALIGHLFGVAELYGSEDFIRQHGMPLHNAGSLLLLSAGVLCARADRGLMAILRSGTPGGTLARRGALMPAVVLLVMGLVSIALYRRLGVPQALGSWALFMSCLTALTAAVWATAEILHEAGLEREEVHRLLEQRVLERTAELNKANEALNAARDELARANLDLERTVHERTSHLKETIRSLETVCYNIAHDLRAPNRAISGFAQVLLAQHGSSLGESARDCLVRIAKAAQRSDRLTLDLLAYGRLGHADLPCSSQSLKDHLTTVAHNLSREIASSHATLEIPDSLPEVWANPTVLDQVLTNLLTNALKFVPEGIKPHVSIRAEDAGDCWRVLVQDNGIGIPPEYQSTIFGVFQRLHPTGTYDGSGIGLAIVQKGIERMGGKVGVRSNPESGSCFWFELPKKENAHEQACYPVC